MFLSLLLAGGHLVYRELGLPERMVSPRRNGITENNTSNYSLFTIHYSLLLNRQNLIDPKGLQIDGFLCDDHIFEWGNDDVIIDDADHDACAAHQ